MRKLIGALGAALALTIMTPATAQPSGYTLNNEPVPMNLAQMMYMNGMPPGAYFIDEYGNFGAVGFDPVINVDGGPVRYSGTKVQDMSAQGLFGSSAPQQKAPAQQPAPSTGNLGGLEGTRIFWVYSPSIFSGASGGASGYIHLCPGGVFYRSSEGSVSVSGSNGGWAGSAGTSQNSGRWQVSGGVLQLNNADGGQQSFAMRLVSQGRWKIGQHKYASERGRASCR